MTKQNEEHKKTIDKNSIANGNTPTMLKIENDDFLTDIFGKYVKTCESSYAFYPFLHYRTTTVT